MNIYGEAPEGLREKVVELIKKYKKNGKVADLGAGYGITSEMIKNDFNVYLFEIEKEKILYLNKGFKNKIIRCNFNNSICAKDDTFDVVVSTEVIEHLEDPWCFLREIKRILKKDGIAIITFPNFTDFISRLRFFFKTEFSFFIKEIPKGGHITILPYWLFEYIVKKTGMRVIEKRTHRSWIKRLWEKSLKHKIALISILPFYLILRIILIGEKKDILLGEDWIYVLGEE